MVLIETVGQQTKIRDSGQKFENPRTKETKETRFRESFKTPPRFRDPNKNFRDPEFSGYHSPPLSLIWFDWNADQNVKKGYRFVANFLIARPLLVTYFDLFGDMRMKSAYTRQQVA